MTRREWIGTTLAAAAPAAADDHRIGRSSLSAITDEIARSPAGAIDFARQYGLRWLELRNVPGARGEFFRLPEDELKTAARELEAARIGISFLNTSMLKYMLPGTEPVNPRARGGSSRFDQRLVELRQAIEAARILGASKIRIFAFSRVAEPEKLLDRLAGLIAEMCRIAEKEDMRLLIENEGSTNIASCAETAALLKRVSSPALGVNWDPLNATRMEEIPFPDGYEKLPKDRIGNVPIKGRTVLPGPERLDWAAVFRRLAADGYRGQIGLETHIFGEGQIQASHDSMREILRIVEPG